MSVKVGTDIVISDGKELNNIAGTDATSKLAIEAAIRAADNKIVIRDSDGTVIKTIYGPAVAS
jgi:hypothetical protein